MRVNEVRKTETIEKLVRTEYIAEDGTVFRSEEECKKYEESALFAISKELKRLDNKKNGASEYDIYDECSDEYLVEIFNAETERDIENIRRYVYLKALSNSSYARKEDVDLPNITAGHEVIIHWNYDVAHIPEPYASNSYKSPCTGYHCSSKIHNPEYLGSLKIS